MVEFAVAVVSMALLALGTVMLARYQSIQFQTIEAARHATYEHSWTGDRVAQDVLQQRSRELFFSNAGWRDPTGRTDLVDAGKRVGVAASEVAAPATALKMMQFLLKPLQLAAGFLGESFDLTSKGLHVSRVTVDVLPVSHLPAPFDSLQLQFVESSALLGDAWNSGSPAQVAQRVSGLVPTHLLARQSSLLQPLSAPIRLLEPAFAQLCLGLVEPDKVPADRLDTSGRRLQVTPAGCP
ncbi:MAG: hypothetical protein ABI859_07535 [Pseudomonadota bacterium]